ELSIAGHGPLFDAIKARVDELGISARVTLEGEIRDVPAMLRKCDIFVFSSISEGLPLVILEAMAAGLPIVATRVGGVPEVAPETLFPWYADPGNAPELADGMLRAAASHELAVIGGEARRLATASYGIAGMTRNYEML